MHKRAFVTQHYPSEGSWLETEKQGTPFAAVDEGHAGTVFRFSNPTTSDEDDLFSVRSFCAILCHSCEPYQLTPHLETGKSVQPGNVTAGGAGSLVSSPGLHWQHAPARRQRKVARGFYYWLQFQCRRDTCQTK